METTVFTVQVQPGDCGPNGIVLVHNFTRWMDAASQPYFLASAGCRRGIG
jgi:4-hydroxybenzoyl-CoA thioesterase